MPEPAVPEKPELLAAGDIGAFLNPGGLSSYFAVGTFGAIEPGCLIFNLGGGAGRAQDSSETCVGVSGPSGIPHIGGFFTATVHIFGPMYQSIADGFVQGLISASPVPGQVRQAGPGVPRAAIIGVTNGSNTSGLPIPWVQRFPDSRPEPSGQPYESPWFKPGRMAEFSSGEQAPVGAVVEIRPGGHVYAATADSTHTIGVLAAPSSASGSQAQVYTFGPIYQGIAEGTILAGALLEASGAPGRQIAAAAADTPSAAIVGVCLGNVNDGQNVSWMMR